MAVTAELGGLLEPPDMFRLDRFGAPVGPLLPLAPVVHTEEVSGEDSIDFMCLEEPEKYDRLLWRDGADGVWREHVVVSVDRALDGTVAVHAEGSVCDLLGVHVPELRVVAGTAAAAISSVLEGTLWEADASGVAGAASILVYRQTGAAALARIREAWGCESETFIEVGARWTVARTLRLVPALGAWRGARLEYAANMIGCVRSVADDEVFTALYGYGEGLPDIDEAGGWSGGYRRRLTFGSVHGGVDWVGDEGAREAWGLPGPDGARCHRFGSVHFPGVTDPSELLARTGAELARVSAPRVSYDVDAALVLGAEDVRLGDTVLVVGRAGEERMRATGRVRALGGGTARFRLGEAARPAYIRAVEAAELARRAEDAADAARAGVTEVVAAAGGAAGAMPALATKEYVDGLFDQLDDLSGEEF